MSSPPASGGDEGTAEGTPLAAVNAASPANNGAAVGSDPSNVEEMPQKEDKGRQEQQDDQEQASGKASVAMTDEQAAAAPAKRRVGQARLWPACHCRIHGVATAAA